MLEQESIPSDRPHKCPHMETLSTVMNNPLAMQGVTLGVTSTLGDSAGRGTDSEL